MGALREYSQVAQLVAELSLTTDVLLGAQVPIKVDYTDLYDVMAFFKGRPGHEATEGHEHLAKKIGAAGKDWAENHWRKEDMAAYMCRLLGIPSRGG